MTTKLIIIIGASIAIVVGMFVLGKLADGKNDDQQKQGTSGRNPQ